MRNILIGALVVASYIGCAVVSEAQPAGEQTPTSASAIATRFLEALKVRDAAVAASLAFPATTLASQLSKQLPVVLDYKIVGEMPCSDTLDMDTIRPQLDALFTARARQDSKQGLAVFATLKTSHPCLSNVWNFASRGVPEERLLSLTGLVSFEARQVVVDVDQFGPGTSKATRRQSLWLTRLATPSVDTGWFVAGLFQGSR